tara:strand:+ start:210 stop:350 length:141 start_codon:yes stop_codon:yes gene_type:complete
MKLTEKIANAQKRIDELEMLIKYWSKSQENYSKIVNLSLKNENKVA